MKNPVLKFSFFPACHAGDRGSYMFSRSLRHNVSGWPSGPRRQTQGDNPFHCQTWNIGILVFL